MTTGMSAPPMRQDGHDAEREAPIAPHAVEEPRVRAGTDDEISRRDSTSAPRRAPMLMKFWPFQVTGAPVMRPCELAEGHDAAGERQKPRNDLEAERADLEVRAEARRALREVLGDADERRREAAERVRERDSLRHLRHRDPREIAMPMVAADEAMPAMIHS